MTDLETLKILNGYYLQDESNDPELSHDPEIDRLVSFLNDNDEDKYGVAYEREYITLYIGMARITQGESEVLSRLKQIKRELGLDFS